MPTVRNIRPSDRAAAAALILLAHNARQHIALISMLLQRITCPQLQAYIRATYAEEPTDAYPLAHILCLINMIVQSPETMLQLMQLLVSAGLTPANIDAALLTLVSAAPGV